MDTEKKKCAECGELIQVEARICRFCGARVEDQPLKCGSYIQRRLLPGEKVIYRTKLHWIKLLAAAFNLFLALFFYLFAGAYAQTALEFAQSYGIPVTNNAWFIYLLLFLSILALIAVISHIAGLIAGEVVVTNQRIVGRLGGVIPRDVAIRINEIHNISVRSSLARLVGAGTISVQLIDRRKVLVGPVPRPEEFQTRVESQFPAGARPALRKFPWARLVLVLIMAPILILAGLYGIYLINTRSDRASQTGDLGWKSVMTQVDSGSAPTAVPGIIYNATPTKKPRATHIPTPSPMVVDFDSINQCEQGERVTIEGILDLPGSMICDIDCGIFLENPENRSQQIPIFINVAKEGKTPSPNWMSMLPDPYRPSDFKVRLDDGSIVGEGARVHVTGRICSTTDGDLCVGDVILIEAATPGQAIEPDLPANSPQPPVSSGSCGGEVKVRVENLTGDTAVLYLSGPCNYTYSISTGVNRIAVKEGKYSITYSMCGRTYTQKHTINSSWYFKLKCP